MTDIASWARGCLGKVRFRAAEFAEDRRKINQKKYKKEHYVYFCKHCGGYHLTTRRRA